MFPWFLESTTNHNLTRCLLFCSLDFQSGKRKKYWRSIPLFSTPRLLSFLVYHKGCNDFSCCREEQSSMVEANRLNSFDGSCTKPSLFLLSVIHHSQHSLSSFLSTLQEDMLYQSTAASIKATRAQNTFFFPWTLSATHQICQCSQHRFISTELPCSLIKGQ